MQAEGWLEMRVLGAHRNKALRCWASAARGWRWGDPFDQARNSCLVYPPSLRHWKKSTLAKVGRGRAAICGPRFFSTVPPRYGKRAQSGNLILLLARIAEPVYRMARVERPTIYANIEAKPTPILTGFYRAVTGATKRL
jgi:hypothetical protein